MDSLSWIQDWYAQHCDGEWEHSYGVSIETLDNPGWGASISIKGTELSEKTFEKIAHEKSDTDWIQCWVAEGKFNIACGPKNLNEALEVFRLFATA